MDGGIFQSIRDHSLGLGGKSRAIFWGVQRFGFRLEGVWRMVAGSLVGGFNDFLFSISYMGCHPKPIDELHHFSRWWFYHQPMYPFFCAVLGQNDGPPPSDNWGTTASTPCCSAISTLHKHHLGDSTIPRLKLTLFICWGYVQLASWGFWTKLTKP